MKRKVAILSALTLVFLELALQVFDPFGQVVTDDLYHFYKSVYPHKTGYTWADGAYSLSHWAYAIEDGRRVVPDADKDGKTVYVIGDSVSFGWGVDDSETFVNILADLLDVNALLLSKPAYNRENLYLVSQEIPSGACVLYFAVHNDDKAPMFYTPTPAKTLLRSVGLVHYIPIFAERQTPKQFGDYMHSLIDAIGANKRLLVVNFEAEFVRGAMVVNSPNRISFFDRHLDAQGNQDIANQLVNSETFNGWLATCD